jgi:hypothetical protein
MHSAFLLYSTLLYSLLFFSLSVSSACSCSFSLSLLTEWWLRSRLSVECIRLRKTDVRETELALLLAETPSRLDIVGRSLLVTRPVIFACSFSLASSSFSSTVAFSSACYFSCACFSSSWDSQRLSLTEHPFQRLAS